MPTATKTFNATYKYYKLLFFVKIYLCMHNIFKTELV